MSQNEPPTQRLRLLRLHICAMVACQHENTSHQKTDRTEYTKLKIQCSIRACKWLLLFARRVGKKWNQSKTLSSLTYWFNYDSLLTSMKSGRKFSFETNLKYKEKLPKKL